MAASAQVQAQTKPNASDAAKPENKDSPFEALIALSDKLKATRGENLSLTDVIGVAEMLTSSLQPLLRRIDSTLQKELRGILSRIEGLRSEILKVRADDISHNRIPMMGRELTAIVDATEGATNSIMEAAEAVLGADPSDDGYAELVSEKMMAIFEACSFQDITGQRVTKVVETVEVIETRVNLLCRMLDMQSFGGGEAEPEVAAREKRKKDLILNGPSSDGVKQDEIDKMF